MKKKTAVLFVCLGNICRSPTAHGVFETLVHRAGLASAIDVDSAGTGDWHIGHAPDKRTTQVALTKGYDLSHLRARLVTPADFDGYDYVVAMDRANLRDLEAMRPASFQGFLGLFLDFSTQRTLSEVPDPYYGGDAGYEQVFNLVEDASAGLLAHICQQHGLVACH